MNDTQHAPPPAGPDDEFDPQRLRTITDMRRSTDDRMVAGVCAGAAKYLNVDPVIVRVVIAVLTVAGFAGVILYAAAWILLPTEHEDKSLAAEWFKLDKNEEQVRGVGLVVAAAVAVLSVIGNSSWAWWGEAPWWIVPFALLFYVFWVRPRRRREQRAAQMAPDPATAADFGETRRLDVTQQKLEKSRRPRSPALTILTLSVVAIALAVTRIWSEYHEAAPWTTYVAIALGIVALGLLVGTFFGSGGPLVVIGILLSVALAVGALVPEGGIGAERRSPTSAADVRTTYRQGIGLLQLDLTDVSDPTALLGRTIRLDAGVGQTRVVVPDGLQVAVVTDLRAGEISLFGRSTDGTDLRMSTSAPTSTALTIRIDQSIGNVEVISR